MNSIEALPPMLPLDACDRDRRDAEPLEDPAVRLMLPVERLVQPGLVGRSKL